MNYDVKLEIKSLPKKIEDNRATKLNMKVKESKLKNKSVETDSYTS